MSLTLEQTVGQMVAENPDRARVFEKYRIDYCCGGKKSLSAVCEGRSVTPEKILDELAKCDANKAESGGKDWMRAPLTELAEHIVSTHHAYLGTELPRIAALAAKVAKVHGDHAPETLEIDRIFQEFRQELEEHAGKEEQILFPWIMRLEAGEPHASPFAASVASPIKCMEKEHENAGHALEQLRELTNNYTPPMDACNTWRVLYASLEALEEDMHRHVHKENSILFPRAIALEAERATTPATRIHL